MNNYAKITSTVLASIFTLSLAGSPITQASKENSNVHQKQQLSINNIPSDAQNEGDHYVKYISDQELKSELNKKGYDTSGFESAESNNSINTYAAKKAE